MQTNTCYLEMSSLGQWLAGFEPSLTESEFKWSETAVSIIEGWWWANELVDPWYQYTEKVTFWARVLSAEEAPSREKASSGWDLISEGDLGRGQVMG